MVSNVRWFFTVLYLWTAVHGVTDVEPYADYLMTAPIEDILEANGLAKPEDVHVTVGASTVYKFVIRVPEEERGVEDPVVEVELKQNGDTFYTNKAAISKQRSVSFQDGIHLFSKVPGGGWAFLYLEDAPHIEFNDSDIAYLPEVPGKNVIAPIVVSGGTVAFSETYVLHNYHSTKAGGLYLTGGANVNVKGGQISHNKAETGAVVVDGSTVVEFEEVQIFENEGSITGAVYTNDEATFIGRKVIFKNQRTGSASTGVFSDGRSASVLVQCAFEGRPISEAYKSCLLDPAVTDAQSCGNSGDITSPALHVNHTAAMTVIASSLTQHSTKRGTILSSGLSQLNVRYTTFTGNVAYTGGGLFLENTRGVSATLWKCKFHDNVARFGGAMVLAGNGSFMINSCRFTQNRAIVGGAVWGNMNQNLDNTTEGVGKASSRATISIVRSHFSHNTAITNGGVLFVKWADISSNLSTFYNNTAGGSGGAIYTDDAYNIELCNSQFDLNSANVSGGAIFASNANTISAINTTFTRHSALENGGAIASVNGAGIVLRNATISDGHVYGSGGGIYTENVERIDLYRSEIIRNEAGESGGALSLGKSSSLELDSVALSPNAAYGSGGAIHALEGMSAVIKNIDISSVNSSSGVISLTSMGTVQLSGFNFEGYKDKTRCGGLEIDGADSLTITGMKFIGNEVHQHGGALCLTGVNSGEFSDLEFSDNEAGISGGAIYIANSNELNFRGTKFKQNFATHQGGAIRGENVTSLNLIGNVFTLNTATWKGGAVYLEGSSIEIQKSNFTYNYAGTNFEGFKNRTSVSNSPQSQSASGIVYARDGGSFQSKDSNYEFNEADAFGGTLALVEMQKAFIQYDKYHNSSASQSGGCILASGVLNLSIWDTTLQYCESASGGALMVEGHSVFEGGYLHIEDNKAHSGGAFLCRGNSEVNLEATNFSLNSAEEGSTASVDCCCDINFRTSAFYRDKDLPGNDDFFHIVEGCGQINSEGCEFYGGERHIWSELRRVVMSRRVLVLVFVVVLLVWICRRRRPPTIQLPKTDSKSSSPGIHPSRA